MRWLVLASCPECALLPRIIVSHLPDALHPSHLSACRRPLAPRPTGVFVPSAQPTCTCGSTTSMSTLVRHAGPAWLGRAGLPGQLLSLACAWVGASHAELKGLAVDAPASLFRTLLWDGRVNAQGTGSSIACSPPALVAAPQTTSATRATLTSCPRTCSRSSSPWPTCAPRWRACCTACRRQTTRRCVLALDRTCPVVAPSFCLPDV